MVRPDDNGNFADELETLLSSMEIEEGKEHELEEMKDSLRRYVDIEQAFHVVPDALYNLGKPTCAMYTSNHGNVFVFKLGLKGDPSDAYIWEVITPISSVVIDKEYPVWDATEFIQRHFIDPLEKGVLYPLFTFLNNVHHSTTPRLVYESHIEDEYTYQLALGGHTMTTIRFNEANRMRYEAKAAEVHTRH